MPADLPVYRLDRIFIGIIGRFQSFKIAGFEAMLWLRKGFGFSGRWNVNDQNDLLARLFGLLKVNKA